MINLVYTVGVPYTKRPPSFVGVCGVRSVADLRELEKRARAILAQRGYFLMAGIADARQASLIRGFSKRLHGIQPFVICDFVAGVPYETTIFRDLELTASYAHGVQLSVLPWMVADFTQLFYNIKRRYPRLTLMLQAHQQIIDGYTPEQIADRIRGIPIDYIFFDPSQSRGIGYDPAGISRYVDVIYGRFPDLGIAVAGGLSGQTIEPLFGPLAKKYPGISCDAFGKLKDSSTGLLSWPAVDDYLQAWRRCIR